jgi:SulP family sulfate permease
MKVLNDINLGNLRGDLFGGVTAAVVALPMALAFGVASGAGAEAGLWGAILIGLFAALFGGTPTLISEPTGPMTVVFAAVVTNLMATHPDQGLAMAFTVVVMAGILQILFGMMRLGKYVTLMPHTVISGFMTGIGFILMILQLGPLLGQVTPPGGVVGTLQQLPALLGAIRPAEAALGVVTLAILFLTPAGFKRVVPPQLVALVVGTVVSLTLLDGADIRRIGEIPTGLPDLQLPTFSASEWETMFINAAVLGMLGCIDALLTSVIADNLTRSRHNSDKELVGQGIGNVVSGLFGGLPGAGATMGTVVNIQAGGRTALSGIVRVTVLLMVVLGAAGLTATIPLAVLAGIAIHVGFNIVDWNFLGRAHRISPKGALIMYAVILLTVFEDLIVAVGVGLFVANIITIRRLSELLAEDIRVVRDPDDEGAGFSERERELLREANGRVLVVQLGGPLPFGAAKAISDLRLEQATDRVLVVDLADATYVGVSAGLALERAVGEAVDAGIDVYLSGATGQVRDRLRTLGLEDRLPEAHVFADRAEAIARATATAGRPAGIAAAAVT